MSSVQTTVRYLLRQDMARKRILPPDPENPERGGGLIVLAMGKMGAGELNYSSDIDLIVFFDLEAHTLAEDIEPNSILRAHRAGRVAAAAAAHRRRLCVPRRSAAATRSGLNAGGGLDRVGAALL